MFHFPEVSERTKYLLQFAGAIVLIVVFGLMLAQCSPVRAAEWGKEAGKYLGPDLQEWYATLKQPDNPTVSCCGDGDAYYADKTDFDPDGALVAIITDTRGDELTRPDGTKVYRPHIEPGTRIRVPPNKVRRHPIPNPTDHTVIFVAAPSVYEGGGPEPKDYYVYCYEPQPLT